MSFDCEVMETLSSSLIQSSGWLIEESQGATTTWTKEDNKRFEVALACVDENTPNRWFDVASLIPGKTVIDVMNQYRVLAADVSNIEKGLVPIPGYLASSSFTLEVSDNHRGFHVYSKRARTGADHERKKGVPWTEDEHRRFLLGLAKHGKGDWRSISRNFVISKTPTQVASHAQKYYLRQSSITKDRRRPSIHDITIVDSSCSDHPNDNKPAPNVSSHQVCGDGGFVVLNSTGYTEEIVAWDEANGVGNTQVSGFRGFQG